MWSCSVETEVEGAQMIMLITDNSNSYCSGSTFFFRFYLKDYEEEEGPVEIFTHPPFLLRDMEDKKSSVFCLFQSRIVLWDKSGQYISQFHFKEVGWKDKL